ncbi:Rhodanese-related sulfurtransferase [Carboxydocella sporoproducens DSM 16521]|uniref:Rhodanese-related sulfurtransferase n=2 Tax=Carboxydocella TaxID=178898 RepID=A0A1T4QUR6_9FIRM|nr:MULTISPECIES: rhodanese-like domain-containing protein [Carboxydocella]AVX21657.1 Rhodanese-related sulfurtransferase [Carboxydocella thermautotrophica]SKA07445.1 Rhodanese-related sulfurtransferase [Carboxydocella sporoproducens DSM 16521]
MKKWLLITLLSGLLIVTGCAKQETTQSGGETATQQQAQATYQDISGEELQAMLAKGEKVTVIDVREPFEYEAGHIKEARLIPMGEIPGKLGELDKNQTIVVVCASGSRSAQVAQYLGEQGFTRVKNLAGGMMAWPGEVVK